MKDIIVSTLNYVSEKKIRDSSSSSSSSSPISKNIKITHEDIKILKDKLCKIWRELKELEKISLK